MRWWRLVPAVRPASSPGLRDLMLNDSVSPLVLALETIGRVMKVLILATRRSCS